MSEPETRYFLKARNEIYRTYHPANGMFPTAGEMSVLAEDIHIRALELSLVENH